MPSRRRRIVVRVIAAFGVLVVVTAVGGYWYERPLLLTGTGYAAHNACAVTELAGRADPATDLPPNPLVPYLRSSVDAGSTRATILGVLAGQRAWFTKGFGCTLSGDRPALGPATEVSAAQAATNPFTTVAVPPSSVPAPPGAVTAAIGRAFGDDLATSARTTLGTRGIVVVQHGRLVAERYAPGFTAQTPQLGWSMSKSVANLLTGRLVQEGKIGLDDAQLRPEWTQAGGATDPRAAITLDQLMRMTSGLAWDETYDLGTPITRMLYLEPDMARYVASRPSAHPPGSYQQYSSGSTNLLCSVLLARAGAGADLPRQQLFAPLGLTSATWEPDAAGTPVCSSYLWATPRDWATIGQFVLQQGMWNGQQLLPKDWMARSTTAQPVATSEEVGYAAGWWVNKQADGTLVDPGLPADAYYADGFDGQRLYVVPSADLVVVRLGLSHNVEEPDLRVAALVKDLLAVGGLSVKTMQERSL